MEKDISNKKITIDLLSAAGFKDTTTLEMKATIKQIFYIDDYSSWQYITNKEDEKNKYIVIDIKKGPTNNEAIWNVHIDNNLFESIGQADIDYVWQFNMLMKIFGSKFRL